MKRLLLIDDERGVTDFVQRAAEEQDFEVHATNGPTSFTESFKNLPPSAIILDLAMPEIDGVEILRWLAEEGCRARIVIISGFDGRVLESSRRLGEAHGLMIVGTLSKPMRLAELRQALTLLGQGT